MKIMHIICGPGAGGAEVFVKDMAIEMSRLGHEVYVVFLQTAKESGRDEDFELHFLDQLVNEGIGYAFIGARSRKNPIFGIVALKKIIKDLNPHIVHSHLYWPLFFLIFIRGFPVVFTKHSIQLGAPRALLTILLARTSAFVAICEACKKKFATIARGKTTQIDNGTAFKVRPARKRTPDSTVKLLYVGRLFTVKNIDLLLKACSRLSDLNFELRIAGEGPELLRLKSLTSTLGIQHKVNFIGNIDDISSEMSESDIFVLSSISEGLPISLIEASLSGLPCLVTDVGGCSEVIVRCRNGFAVPSNDVESYAQKLRILIEDDDLRRTLSLNARKYSQHYSIGRAVAEHLSLYKTIL